MRSLLLPIVFGLSVAALPANLTAQEVVEAGAGQVSADDLFADGQAAMQAGNLDEAVAAFREAARLAPKDGRNWHMLGFCLHGQGKLDEALEMHQKAATFPDQAPVATYNIACVHSLKGDKDKAFEWLGKARELGFDNRGQLEGDTDMDNIRDDPRFAKMLESMGYQLQAYVVTTPRESARVAYFGAGGSPGQIAIDYAPVPWKDGYEKQADSPKMIGEKWRFGGDFWTTLDCTMPIVIGGVEVPAGYWYLTLTKQEGDKFVMGVHDPMVARKMQLDPSACNALPAGIEVPLQHGTSDMVQDKLQVSLNVGVGKANTDGQLKIRFGNHKLYARVAVGIGDKKQKQ